MAASSNFFIPGSPVNVPLRPLNKGVQRHLPSQMAPEGSLYDVNEFQVTLEGLKRRAAYTNYIGSIVALYPPIQEPFTFTNVLTGEQKLMIMDQKFIYKKGSTSWFGVYWKYNTGTISTTSGNTIVTGSGTSWVTGSPELQGGDVLVIDVDGNAGGPQELEILSVDNDTQITLVSAPSLTLTGEDYEIRRAFKAENARYIDFVFAADGSMYLVDGSRTMYEYDGSALIKADPSATSIPKCIAYFRDRLFIGNILETGTGNEYRFRIRWSDPGVFGSFPATNYVDLPYQSGEIIDLAVMGNTLVAFFNDALYIGTPTQMPTMPVYFQRYETGGIGLVGMKAFTTFTDSIFFVGQDNIYMLSIKGIEPIGTPVVKASVEKCSNLSAVYAVADPARSRIIFGFPKENLIEDLWLYDYKAKAWGKEKISCSSLGVATVYTGFTIDDLDTLSATIDGLDATMTSIDDAAYGGDASENIMITVSGILYVAREKTSDDFGSIIASLETQDYDLGKPNMDKTFSRLSLKLQESIASTLSFNVQGSTNRGNTWSTLGTLSIPIGHTEGKVDFKLTGSLGRFKLTSTTDNLPYVINEIVLRVKLRGQEDRF